jgi:hypothetical protein
MFELVTTRPDCNVSEAEYVRLLVYPRQRTLEDRARELADGARAWYAEHGRPWIYARETEAVEINASHFRVNGTEFSSQLLCEQFSATHTTQAVVVAVSAGLECEDRARALWADGKPDEYYFLEMFGSAVVEQLIATANGHICAWADAQKRTALPHHSPGYSGWNISEQPKLWHLLPGHAASGLPGKLTVLESGMLRPKKSLLALVGIASHRENAAGRARLIPCETCALPSCQFRRAPYKPSRRPALSWPP